MADNFAALRDFRERWRHLADAKMRELQRFVLTAGVTFESKVLNGGDQSRVSINCQAGPDDGSITIDETEILVLAYLHLDFSAKFQDYSFDHDTGALAVCGSSAKMRGPYVVLIQPTEVGEDDHA